MMEKFIYVFDTDARNTLLMCGYKLFKSDDERGVYVFYNNEKMHFSDKEMTFTLSNTISF